MEARIEKVKQQLQSQGYKLTPQREATVRVLLENEEDHLSAEDVFMLVKARRRSPLRSPRGQQQASPSSPDMRAMRIHVGDYGRLAPAAGRKAGQGIRVYGS
jgi:hypothetical protein